MRVLKPTGFLRIPPFTPESFSTFHPSFSAFHPFVRIFLHVPPVEKEVFLHVPPKVCAAFHHCFLGIPPLRHLV